MIRRLRGERGSVTAEFAVALPALILLLLVAVGAVNAVFERLRCVDAARDAALAQARGADGVAAGRRRAPAGADIAVWSTGDLVHARVTVVVHMAGGRLPGITVTADAVAEEEP